MGTIENRNKFAFDSLFIFDIANNHQGSVDHGLRIIRELGAVASQAGVRAALKLQFRELDSFIHPAYREGNENRHIRRFLSTRLSERDFGVLLDEARRQSLTTMATPFDEPSVDLLVQLGVEVVKIGSCSASDWPLLEKAVTVKKPIVVSTGGLTLKDTDNVVSFLDHRYAHFAILHCVAIYPTPIEKLRLDRIAMMRERYPTVPIGLSSHEDPANTRVIQMAYAKGARLFERHVGIATEKITLNAYSSTPAQIAQWIAAWQEASAACAAVDGEGDPAEMSELRTLMRGVYARNDIAAGQPLSRDEVFFAMPLQSNQLPSGRWRETLVADRDYPAGAAVSDGLTNSRQAKKEIVYQTIHEVKGMLNAARIPVGTEFNIELSHHYGIERFREVGVIIIDCVNREYCKKILVQLPGQQHPYHHHKKKEETFQLLAGELEVELEGNSHAMHPGDVLVIQRGVRHRFRTDRGAIFEEISTTHFDDDSLYEDPAINATSREERKTRLINWGRHQFD